MKRFLFVCLGAIAFCAGCSKNEPTEDSGLMSSDDPALNTYICEKTKTSLVFDIWNYVPEESCKRLSITDNSPCYFVGTMTLYSPGLVSVFYYTVDRGEHRDENKFVASENEAEKSNVKRCANKPLIKSNKHL